MQVIEEYWELKKNAIKRRYFYKRLFDFLLSASGIVILTPVMIFIFFAIIFEDGFPAFYTQERVGKDGKIFKFYKFRSMVKDAEKDEKAVLADVKDERVTKVGRFLRTIAFDEIPQLFNIFKGDLSFVGPRPERPEILSDILGEYPRFSLRNVVLPGLTGVAQVYGNYDSGYKKKLKYDLFYIKNLSFALDIKLIVKSIIMTLKGNWNAREKRRRALRQTLRKIRANI